MKRKIAVITGARMEYGYVKPLMQKIKQDQDLELLVYVTGMHLLPSFGNSIEEIKKDGFEITGIVDMEEKENSSLTDLSISIGKGIVGFANAFGNDKPDIVVVPCDRIEPFAAATAATVMNIPVAHTNGGETAMADIDNNLRHAITKLSHLHFVSSEQSRKRVLMLGEQEFRVFNVGSLSLDNILNMKLLSKKALLTKYQVSLVKPFILVIYNPVTTEATKITNQIKIVTGALHQVAKQRNMTVVVIYPNAYPGSSTIIETINKLNKENDNWHLFKNLPHLDFISLMKHCQVFVGNSSSGILEAPSLGAPYVCIGNRQQGRERAHNVIDASLNEQAIIKAIDKAISDKKFITQVKKCVTIYGNGVASQKILKVLKQINIDKKLLQKKLTY